MRLDLSLLLGSTAHGAGPSAPLAPGLTWDNDTENALPLFDVTFNSAAAIADVVEMERDTSAGFGSAVARESTVTGVAPAILSIWDYDTWTNSTYYVRIRHKRGLAFSVWSTVLTVTLAVTDNVKPVLSAQNATETGATTGTFVVSTDHASDVYIVVTQGSSPTKYQIVNGLNAAGGAAIISGVDTSGVIGVRTFNLNGLSLGQTYNVYATQRKTNGYQADIVTDSFTTAAVMTSMITPFFFGHVSTFSNSAVRYLGMTFGGNFASVQTTAAGANMQFPIAGTIKNLTVDTKIDVATGSYVIDVLVNGSATGLTVTCNSGSGQVVRDTTNSAAISAGDLVCLRITPSGTPTNLGSALPAFSFTITAANGQSMVMGPSSTVAAVSTVHRSALHSSPASSSTATENVRRNYIPVGGTFDRLYIFGAAAPGAGNSVTFTLIKNGTDTALAVTLSGTSLQGTPNTSDTVTVTAGDSLSWKMISSAGVSTSTVFNVAMRWTPTTNGEALIGNLQSGAGPSTSAVNYAPLFSGENANATEAAITGNVAPIALGIYKMLSRCLDSSPGAGKSRTTSIRVNGADPSPSATATISGTDFQNTSIDGTTITAVAAGDRLRIKFTPSGTPAASKMSLTAVAYIAPVA